MGGTRLSWCGAARRREVRAQELRRTRPARSPGAGEGRPAARSLQSIVRQHNMGTRNDGTHRAMIS